MPKTITLQQRIIILEAENKHLRKVMRAILNYEPQEVAIDEFAYNRMVDNYRDAARAGLKG